METKIPPVLRICLQGGPLTADSAPRERWMFAVTRLKDMLPTVRHANALATKTVVIRLLIKGAADARNDKAGRNAAALP